MSKIQKYILFGLALLLNTVASWGQISGKVVDTNKKPLEGIIIALLNSPDSTYINGTMTDSIGHFAFTETSLPKTCIIRKTKCSRVLKRSVWFTKTKRSLIHNFSLLAFVDEAVEMNMIRTTFE